MFIALKSYWKVFVILHEIKNKRSLKFDCLIFIISLYFFSFIIIFCDLSLKQWYNNVRIFSYIKNYGLILKDLPTFFIIYLISKEHFLNDQYSYKRVERHSQFIGIQIWSILFTKSICRALLKISCSFIILCYFFKWILNEKFISSFQCYIQLGSIMKIKQ